nr:ATP phosphoribosyltransferase 1, chloroplastic [Tanacetum cinerariifolium]
MNDQLSQDETYNNYEVPQENVEPRRSKHAKVTKDFGPDYMTYIVNKEPQTYKAAMKSSKSPYWKEAIQSEIDSIVQNNTWKLVDLPPGHKPIGHKDHWDALVRVLQYLKHTMAYGLHYTKYPLVLEGYCDANWISNHNEGKSTGGYVFTLRGAAVSWKSSKQTVNTRSTMEAKFVALDKAAEEAEWLRSFLEGIPLWPKPVTAVAKFSKILMNKDMFMTEMNTTGVARGAPIVYASTIRVLIAFLSG